MAVSRRLLFEAAGAAAFGFAFIAANRFACRFVPRNHPDFFALLDVAPLDETSLRIGRLALVRSGAPRDIAEIEAAFRSMPLLRQAMGASCPRTRADLVRDQCAMNFEDGRVVELDGWLLSETEAAICAARAMLA